MAFALRSCATLGDHYRLAGRYMRLVHQGIYLRLEEEQDVARLVHGHYEEPSTPPRHPVEGMLALTLLQGHRTIGEEFAPRAVCFVHARPQQGSEPERIFRAPVHYGCSRNELVIERALLSRPQRRAEPRLVAMLDRQLAQPSPHPQGQYHYHGLPTCVTSQVDQPSGPSHIIGYGFDGFPIYGDRDINGQQIKPETLDECNGIESPTPEFPNGIYHYVMLDVPTAQSTIRCLHGKPSFPLSAP